MAWKVKLFGTNYISDNNEPKTIETFFSYGTKQKESDFTNTYIENSLIARIKNIDYTIKTFFPLVVIDSNNNEISYLNTFLSVKEIPGVDNGGFFAELIKPTYYNFFESKYISTLAGEQSIIDIDCYGILPEISPELVNITDISNNFITKSYNRIKFTLNVQKIKTSNQEEWSTKYKNLIDFFNKYEYYFILEVEDEYERIIKNKYLQFPIMVEVYDISNLSPNYKENNDKFNIVLIKKNII